MLFLDFEIGKLDTGEVEEGCAVVGGEFVGGLVVVGAGAVEGGVDNVLDAVECVEDGLAFVEVGACGGGLGEGEVD